MRFEPVVCCTGQHERLVRQAMASFGIEADIRLEAMSAGQSLGQLASRLFEQLDRALGEVEPDWVVVQGDTASAMVAATCAFYRRVPVGHVEAGLRTGNRLSPFPEEINRVMVSRVADLHFAPTARAAANLAAEGVARDAIHLTGNTIVDALDWIRPRIETDAGDAARSIVDRLGAARFILATTHRRESFGDGIEQICRALLEIVAADPHVGVVFINHLNPDVREPVRRLLRDHPRIVVTDPVDYVSLLYLMSRCTLVLTDSGGIQEEAPSFGKPLLVLREVTERPEAVEAGCARVVGTGTAAIVAAASELLRGGPAHDAMVATANPFGDGKAGERIARLLVHGEA